MSIKLDLQLAPNKPWWHAIEASKRPSIASMIDSEKFKEVQAAKAKSNLALGLGIGAALLVVAGGAYFVVLKPDEFTQNCGYMPNRRTRRRKGKSSFRLGYSRGYRAGRKHCRR